MLRLCTLLVLGAALGACADRPPSGDSASAAIPVAVTGGAVDSAGAQPACPADGRWSQCAIIERLERSGLAPRLDSTTAPDEPPLTERGFLVHLGRAQLEVYLFVDDASRARAAARLDRSRYIEYTANITMDQKPTLIMSGNAIAILHSRSNHQRERVGNAITAGAPSRKP